MDIRIRSGLFIAGALPFLFLLQAAFPGAAPAQSLGKFDRDRGHSMLSAVKNDIKKNYYDPNFHGMDLETRFKAADEKIDQATSLGQIFGIIAQALIDLNDSHTFFMPPSRTTRTEYGWQMQMIGEKCFVVAVKPGSDAEAKGLKPGDEVISVNGYTPARSNLWIMQYLFYSLRPVPALRLVLRGGDGRQNQIDVMAKTQTGKRVYDLTGQDGGLDIWNIIRESESESRLHRHRYYEIGDDLFIWKMPEFDLPNDKVDEMMDKARKRKAIILDLRGNPGGYQATLLRLVGSLFDHDVKVADLKRRKESKPLMAKTRGGHAFGGKLVVLVDSRSASAAELLARVVQLEKRGTVVGDLSAGAVMEAQEVEHQLGADTVIFYAASVTDADMIMSDGKSLEHAGVVPDLPLLPTAADLGSKRDPVLSQAASLAGVSIAPEKAGELFPIEWRK